MVIDNHTGSLTALRTHASQFRAAAEKIARLSQDTSTKALGVKTETSGAMVRPWQERIPLVFREGQSHLSLAHHMVKQKGAQRAYEAQLLLIKSEDENTRELLNIAV